MRSYTLFLMLTLGCVSIDDAIPPTPWSCPANEWDAALPPQDLVGEGFFKGQILHDAKLTDQNGDTSCLWQFYGDLLVVDIGFVNCGPCRELAQTVQETANEFADVGFSYVSILTMNEDGDPPTVSDLEDWARIYEIQQPVLSDPAAFYSEGALDGHAYPAVMIIDREMRVYKRPRMTNPERVPQDIYDTLLELSSH